MSDRGVCPPVRWSMVMVLPNDSSPETLGVPFLSAAAAMTSNNSVDFPDPDTPTMPTSDWVGREQENLCRLWHETEWRQMGVVVEGGESFRHNEDCNAVDVGVCARVKAA